MADHQAITQNIRAYLRLGVRDQTDELADLAAGYATLCREANLRLRRCLEYVRGGYRSEAAHLAKCQPELGGLVSALQIPEARQWAELCATHALDRAPALLDGWDEVKTALKQERAIKPLLARHRLLAVARAAIAERLRIVRLLVTHDPDNPLWPAEARELETARLTEMAQELTAATSAADTAAIDQLWAELAAHPWEADVPEVLREGLEAAERRRRQASITVELDGLAPKLLGLSSSGRASANGDARGDVERWNRLMQEEPNLIPPTLVAQVRESIEKWTEERERQHAAEEAQLVGRLFRPAAGAPADPYQQSPPRRRWLFWLITLMLLAAGLSAYLLWFPQHLARIRSFLTGGG